jgi:hypothetical protein
MSAKITIIKPTTAAATLTETDRAGGVQHGLIAKALDATIGALDQDEVAKGLNSAIEQVQSLVAQLDTRSGHLKPSEISVGLAISAGGGIGVATVGVEASIELTFSLT